MSRRLLPLVVILGLLAMAAPAGAHVRIYRFASYPAQRAQTTTLITPQGQPVGGPWQRWLNESQVPTYRGTMVLDVSTADDHRLCNWAGGLTGGCSNNYAMTPPPAWTQDQITATPETIVNPTDELTQGKPPQDPLLPSKMRKKERQQRTLTGRGSCASGILRAQRPIGGTGRPSTPWADRNRRARSGLPPIRSAPKDRDSTCSGSKGSSSAR